MGPSHELCAESTFSLCNDEACTLPWTDTQKADLENNGTTWLHVKDDLMFNDTTVYLQRQTRGQVAAVQKLKISTCGLEVIKSNIKSLTKTFFVGQKQGIIKGKEYLSGVFSSNSLCPIVSSRLVEKVGR